MEIKERYSIKKRFFIAIHRVTYEDVKNQENKLHAQFIYEEFNYEKYTCLKCYFNAYR